MALLSVVANKERNIRKDSSSTEEVVPEFQNKYNQCFIVDSNAWECCENKMIFEAN